VALLALCYITKLAQPFHSIVHFIRLIVFSTLKIPTWRHPFLPISNFFFSNSNSQMSILTIKVSKLIFLPITFLHLTITLYYYLFFHEPWNLILSTNVINHHLDLIKTFAPRFLFPIWMLRFSLGKFKSSAIILFILLTLIPLELR